jgi:hypothetical protein
MFTEIFLGCTRFKSFYMQNNNRIILFLKPLKQHDSETYCSFTGIKISKIKWMIWIVKNKKAIQYFLQEEILYSFG